VSTKESNAALACTLVIPASSASCAINSALFINDFFSCLNNKTNLSAFLVQQNLFIEKQILRVAPNPLNKGIAGFFEKCYL
jgi:hypothetical protein